MTWEAVIGMEVHLQLRTGRKLFCMDAVAFGDPPNSHVCPVCLGLPGALPVPDAGAVALAVRTALALGCSVHESSVWARKNYFYPDLPKGYQITQFEAPLATEGVLEFDGEDGPSTVRIRRVHMEEDAGKSVHGRFEGATGVDLNRAGTPLVEIVTEPDLKTPGDARAFLQSMKRLLEYLEVSDCSMEEGSLRADANVSVRPEGSTVLEVKTEIKNVNSFAHIEKALTIELERQVGIRESGGFLEPQTLLWDDHRQELRTMRTKEESQDYRYFPEPDLPPLVLDADEMAEGRRSVPELPRARRDRFVSEYGLPDYDAEVLTRTRAWADYYEAVACETDAKEASNWVMGPVTALVTQRETADAGALVSPTVLAELIGMVEDGTLSHGSARKVLEMVAGTGQSAAEVVRREGLAQVSDPKLLEGWVASVLLEHPDEAARYRAGEKKVVGFLMGRVMARSSGNADPKVVRGVLLEALDRD